MRQERTLKAWMRSLFPALQSVLSRPPKKGARASPCETS